MDSGLSYANKTVENILKELQTRSEGLTDKEVKERQQKYGLNILNEKKFHGLSIFFHQLTSPFIYLLFAAAGIALFLGDYIEAAMITFFVTMNTLLGFYQEYKAEQAILLLKKYILSTVKVRRNGKEVSVMSTNLVPGDIIIVEPGDVMPADVRFIEQSGLMVDESTLTGESIPIEKTAEVLKNEPEQLFQALNIGNMGTVVVGGKGVGVIFATAKKTAMGSIVQETEEATRETIFAKEMASFSRFVILLIVITLLLIFMLNLLFKGFYVSFGQLLIFSIALAVTITPEALPIVITFSLSRGAIKLAQHKVIVKRLSAIEDLGSIDILCSDKTGTLTENKLSVADVYGSDRLTVLKYANFSASIVTNRKVDHRINPIDEACWQALPVTEQENIKQYKILYEIPFDPIRLRTVVIVEHDGIREMVVKGILEAVLSRCSIDEQQKDKIVRWIEQQESQGNRVLVVANKKLPAHESYEKELSDEKNLNFVGIVALNDPIKKDVYSAILKANKLGVKLKILTGDSPIVAQGVGMKIGLIKTNKEVITGAEFNKLSPEEKRKAVDDHTVFARVEPQQKVEIIQLLQKKNQVGYMGDGINDAPALKIASVAIVVQGAAEVARDAADIILLKKSLNVIIDGIYQGRLVFTNTLKYLKISFSSVFGNFFSVALISLFLDFLPMLPLQILLINLLSDFPLIAIATDTVAMQELRKPNTLIFKNIFLLSIMLAVVSCSCDFIVVYLFYRISPAILQTNLFIENILTALVAIYSIRTKMPFFKATMPSITLIILTIVAIIITLVLPLTNLGQRVFSFTPPTSEMYVKIFFIVVLFFIGTESAKLLYYRIAEQK